MTRKIDISHKTVFFITAFLLLLWVIYLIKDIILLVFVAFILMSAFAPLVSRLVKFKVPKVLAVILVFIVFFGSLIALIAFGFTSLINQTTNLSQKLADSMGTLLQSNLVNQSVIRDELTSASHQVVTFSLGLFENLISFVSVIVITLYLLLDREKFENLATSLFVNRKEKARRVLDKIEDKLGSWLRGQILLSLLIGVLVYGGLNLLGMDYALPLAIIAALLEVVPVIGPIISAIPGVLIALTVSPLLAALVGGMYLIIQQLEGHLIVPQVMKKAVGLNPLLVILAISIGGRLLGIGGALLAVPIAVVIQVILEEVLKADEA